MRARRTWIVVADSARARIFQAGKRTEGWRLVEEHEHWEARARGAELLTAMPAMETGELPKEREAKVFARQLAGRLEAGFHAHAFDALALVAPPEMMGLLRAELPQTVRAVVQHELVKDFSQLQQHELEDRIERW